VDLISSAKQISFEQRSDFIAQSAISLKSLGIYGIINSKYKILTVNFHSTIGLLLLTKPMVGVFHAK